MSKKYITKTFPKEDLRAMLWGDHTDDYEVVSNEQVDNSRRWSDDYYLVFKHGDKLWGVSYSQGKTEQQDESPFEWEPDDVECYQVEAYEVVTTDYRQIVVGD